jgi:hypothetical protein
MAHAMPVGALLVAGLVAGVSRAQTCVDGLCFTDRVQAGEIDLGALPGGVAVIDYDGDGWMDLYLAGRSGAAHRLYRNEADAMRPGFRTFVDVTAGSGLDLGDGSARTGRGAVVADIDNDGDQDLYVLGEVGTAVSAGLLYRNDGGRFTDVSVGAGVRTTGVHPESAVWLDLEHDGDCDLLVGYTGGGGGRAFDLFVNLGDGSFVAENGRLPALGVPSHNYSMTATDFDADGWPDVVTLTTAIGAKLLRNVEDGAGGRRLEDVGAQVGYAGLGPAPMGVSAGDFDNDGDFDLSITDGATGTSFENIGGGFEKITPVESIFGWGVSWLDADNDGLLDLFHAGSFARGPMHNKLFRNLGGGAFEDLSPALNDTAQDSKNAVRIDIGNDGRPDLVFCNPAGDDQRTGLLENVSTTPGAWLAVNLVGDGRLVNTDAIGAVVRVRAGGVTLHREVVSGSSTCSTEDLRAHFGLGGAAEAEWVEVVWPRRGSVASRTERLGGPIAPGQILTIEPRCPADYNADGQIDTRDFLAYLNGWAAGESRADLTGDGQTDTQDVLAFLNLWTSACG